MICDEFAMKRIGGLFRQVAKNERKPGPDGLTPVQVLKASLAGVPITLNDGALDQRPTDAPIVPAVTNAPG